MRAGGRRTDVISRSHYSLGYCFFHNNSMYRKGGVMNKSTNYKAIFFSGLTFVGAGVALSITLGPVGIALIGGGIAMMAIGLSKKSEWSKD